jgi:hypothetical protein
MTVMFSLLRPSLTLALFIALASPGPSGARAAPPAAVGPGEPACQIFPPDNPWNTDVSTFPVHPQSDAYVDQIGRSGHLHPDVGTVWEGAPIGIPYAIVNSGQPKVPVSFNYADESDPGPYPIPLDVPIEGGPAGAGDRHVIVIDQSTCILYEMFDSHVVDGGQLWQAGSGAVFNLNSNALRPDYWTSADAAGLPIFAGLVRYSEVVEQGVIDHALRFTVAATRRAFMHPATHYASSNTSAGLPPMGLRFRMKASYSCGGFSAEVRVICAALKKYGMLVADNGSDWFISGAPDDRWNDDALGDMKQISGDAFEVVNTGEPVITESGSEPPPPAPTPAPPPATPTPALGQPPAAHSTPPPVAARVDPSPGDAAETASQASPPAEPDPQASAGSASITPSPVSNGGSGDATSSNDDGGGLAL